MVIVLPLFSDRRLHLGTFQAATRPNTEQCQQRIAGRTTGVILAQDIKSRQS
jgi:hypothetical protein